MNIRNITNLLLILGLYESSYGGIKSVSGYFSFKKVTFRLSHSSENRSGEDEGQWAWFSIVIRRVPLHVSGIDMTLIVEKEA